MAEKKEKLTVLSMLNDKDAGSCSFWSWHIYKHCKKLSLSKKHSHQIIWYKYVFMYTQIRPPIPPQYMVHKHTCNLR